MSHSLLLEPRGSPDLGERRLMGQESERGRSLIRGWSQNGEESDEGLESAQGEEPDGGVV